MTHGKYIQPIILCGGKGQRLLPLSRASKPKPFLKLGARHSFLQKTLLRVKNKELFLPPVLIGNSAHRSLINQDLQGLASFIETQNIKTLYETESRNTALSIALGAAYCKKHNINAPLLFLPADHFIPDTKAFEDMVQQGQKETRKNITCFGLKPVSAETHYGYIDTQNQKFTEKPDKQTAMHYIETGHYLWNMGVYMGQAEVFLKTCQIFHQNIESALAKLIQDTQTMNITYSKAGALQQLAPLSFDKAVMEKLDSFNCIETEMAWRDVGSWTNLMRSQIERLFASCH